MRTMNALAAALLLFAALLGGCGGDEAPGTRKLLVIGIDSADWRLLDPLMEEGRIPNLAALRAQSASGRMLSFVPLEKSPLLWASICSGVRPEVHGVAHFVRGDTQEPVRSAAWRAPAIWDVLGAAGLTTAVTGMWTTYPARPIDGVMVSDYLTYGRKRAAPLANLVFPDSLTDAVIGLRVAPEDITDDQLTRFIDPDRLAEAHAKWPREIEQLKEAWAADLSYLAVNRMLAQDNSWDLFFFYLRGPDMVSHHFYHYLDPEHARVQIDPGEAETFGHVVPRYYEWVDEVVGEVLGWFPPGRQVVVLSDHGFHGPRPQGSKGVNEHSEWGVFMVRSPLYQAGARFDKLDLLDVCPTMLGLIGLPAGGDMPGHVLADALTPEGEEIVRRLEGNRLPSYMALTPAKGPEGERDPAVDAELRRQLKALGYIN